LKFGMIGARTVSQAVAGHVVKAGHDVVIRNSRGAHTLGSVVKSLRARRVTVPQRTPSWISSHTATGPRSESSLLSSLQLTGTRRIRRTSQPNRACSADVWALILRTPVSYTIFEGTSEIQRLVVARSISGLHIP
jgi:hypothetical protein